MFEFNSSSSRVWSKLRSKPLFTTGDCSRCLNQIQYGQPNFTYSCTKITYQYVLRFFNRFASEICYAMCLYNYKNISRINVVSLGCGPGSEVYGIIKALRF